MQINVVPPEVGLAGFLGNRISFVTIRNPTPGGSALPTWPQWDNTVGVSKSIAFDADLNKYLLGIDTRGERYADIAPEVVTVAKAIYAAWAPLFGPLFDIVMP